MVEKSGVEKSRVGKFMVEKSGVERFGVEKSGVEMSFNRGRGVQKMPIKETFSSRFGKTRGGRVPLKSKIWGDVFYGRSLTC